MTVGPQDAREAWEATKARREAQWARREEQIDAGVRALKALARKECTIPEHGNGTWDPAPAALCVDCEAAAVLDAIKPLIAAAIEANDQGPCDLECTECVRCTAHLVRYRDARIARGESNG